MEFSAEDCLIFLGRAYSELRHNEVYRNYFIGMEVSGYEDSFSVSSHGKGIELKLTDELVCKAIFFFSEESEDRKAFSDLLPLSLDFSMSITDVRKLLGLPHRSGGGEGEANIFYGSIPQWDKYLFDGFSLHVQYNSELSRIKMLTAEMVA